MKARIRLQSACVLVLCLFCISLPTWGVDLTAQLSMTPTPIGRGETLTLAVLLDNESGQPSENTTLYVPLPVGIDQWKTEVRIDGAKWVAYPANGLIELDPIPALGRMAVDIRVPVEQGSPATLTVTAQLLDATGILAEVAGWVNVLPNVDAGPDLIVELGTSTTLSDPSASDGDGAIAAYFWTDIGVGGTFDDSGALHATYTPPAVSGVIELSLTVTDVDGGESSDSLRVRVNVAPSVEIGEDVETDEGSRIQLWQTTVSDPDGWIAGIVWSDGDAGGTFLPSNDIIDPVYSVPEITGCGNGVIVLALVVTDDWGATGTDRLTVTVNNVNDLPVVYVPDDLEVAAGQRVELSAIAVDDDGWIDEQGWEQIEAIDVDLVVGSQEQHISFDAPDVEAPRELLFRFRAIDNCGAEVWGDVSVMVLPEDGPDEPPVDDSSMTINLDVFDDRGLPMSPFDLPRDEDLITVRLSVINTGSSKLEQLDANLNNRRSVGLLSDALDPWGSTTGTCDWLVRSDDLVGGLEIVATVTGIDAVGKTITASDAFRFLGERPSNNPALVLEKTVSVSEAAEGEVIVYGYRMTNPGSNNLVGLTLYDDQLGRIDFPATLLRAGEAIEVQVSYTVRESDLPGPLANRAVATGFTLQGDKVEAEAGAHVELLSVAGGAGGAPQLHGRVVISEIAWAGDPADPAGEWIELANIGTAPVDLTGWRLSWYEKTGMVPVSSQWHSIELSGVIHPLAEDAGKATKLEFVPLGNGFWSVHDPRWSTPGAAAGFFIIERAHDGVIGNIRADLVYGDSVNPYFDLPDAGASVFLIDPDGKFVDSANAQYADGTGWPAGNLVSHATMERINLSQGDFDGNWQTTSGVLTFGVDASGRGLLATAGQPNSLPLEDLLQDGAASVSPVLTSGRISVPIPELAASDRPTIQIATLTETIAAGGGGAVGRPEVSTIRSGGELTIEVNMEHALNGVYFVWISLQNGKTLLLPLRT